MIEIDARRFTEKGLLCVVEEGKDIPFEVKRVFYIFPDGKEPRGKHAQKTLREVVFCLKGQVTITIDDGKSSESITLDQPNKGVLIEANTWRELHSFKDHPIILVLASELYDPTDYIRDYDEFLEGVRK